MTSVTLARQQGKLDPHNRLVAANLTSVYFSRLSVDQQCRVFSLLGQLACKSATKTASGAATQFSCSFCDLEEKSKALPVLWEDSGNEEIVNLFLVLTKGLRAPKHRRPRVAAMTAVVRLLSHTSNHDHLNLQVSPLGQLCLGGLHSSVRELRVAAG